MLGAAEKLRTIATNLVFQLSPEREDALQTLAFLHELVEWRHGGVVVGADRGPESENLRIAAANLVAQLPPQRGEALQVLAFVHELVEWRHGGVTALMADHGSPPEGNGKNSERENGDPRSDQGGGGSAAKVVSIAAARARIAPANNLGRSMP